MRSFPRPEGQVPEGFIEVVSRSGLEPETY